MPKSKTRKHPPHKPKVLKYDPRYTDGLTPDLRHTLKTKLTLPELVELEKQLRNTVKATAQDATIACHKTTWAVVLRVLHDRFGFEVEEKKRLYELCTEYLHDVADGRLSLQDMIDTLEYEDGVVLDYTGAGGEAEDGPIYT